MNVYLLDSVKETLLTGSKPHRPAKDCDFRMILCFFNSAVRILMRDGASQTGTGSLPVHHGPGKGVTGILSVGDKVSGRSRRLIKFGLAVAAGLMAGLMLVLACAAAESAQPTSPEAQQKALEKMVRQAERHLEHTIKKEGVFSARVALNVWKSTSLDAGLYDQAAYDAYHQRIYTRAIEANRRWFEGYLRENNLQNAATCLEFWRLHSQELGVLDLAEYEALRERLKNAPKAKEK